MQEFVRFIENPAFLLGSGGAILIFGPYVARKARSRYAKICRWREDRKIVRGIYDGSLEREVMCSYKDPDSKL